MQEQSQPNLEIDIRPESTSTPQPATTKPVVPQTSFTLSHKNTWLLAIVGILGLALIFLAGVAFSLWRQTTSSSAQLTPTLQPTPSATPTMDESADWKTYSNEEFSFQYPTYMSEMKLREQAYGELQPLPAYESISLDPNKKGGGPGYTTLLSIRGPESNPRNLSTEDWLVANNQDSFFAENGEARPTNKLIETINEKSVIHLIDNLNPPHEHLLYFSTPEGIYSISYRIFGNTEEAIKYNKDFNRILATFEFIPTASKSGWSVSQSKAFGLTIEYPPELTEAANGEYFISFGFGKQAVEGPSNEGTISFKLQDAHLASTFQALLSAEPGADVFEAHGASDVKTEKLKNVTLQSYQAVEYNRDGISLFNKESGRGPIGYEHNYMIKINNEKYITITSAAMDLNTLNKNEPIYQEIISLLRFD